MVDVQPVSGWRDTRRFIAYAYERNRDDPHRVPPLRLTERRRLSPSGNPFFAHADLGLLLARCGGHVVGRVAAIDDRRHNERHGDNLGTFGFFDRRRRSGWSAAGSGRGVGARGGPGARPRAAEPVAQRERGPARRGLRRRPDADDAAQPTRVRGLPGGVRVSEGQGSVRVAL
jgi:hypothetical protein